MIIFWTQRDTIFIVLTYFASNNSGPVWYSLSFLIGYIEK